VVLAVVVALVGSAVVIGTAVTAGIVTVGVDCRSVSAPQLRLHFNLKFK
jgi:hypothetical protein